MGFLTVNGHLMTYDEYKHLINLYRAHGILQFMRLYNVHKDREIAPEDLHWGEEIEYSLYKFDDAKKRVQLSCDADDIINDFTAKSAVFQNFSDSDEEEKSFAQLTDMERPDFKLLPEFGNWMIEAVPNQPYGSYVDPTELLSCTEKIANRRAYLDRFLKLNREIKIVSTAASPILGMPNCLTSENEEIRNYLDESYNQELSQINKHTHQSYLPEKAASPHPRFLGLAQSIYERRGKKVDINVPLYQDENTQSLEATDAEPFPGMIHMDAMHFGMGSSCLQITYEAQNVHHARFLYDMFIPWTPIMSVLSASTPLLKGQVSDHDFRWEVIEQSVDCRTDIERDPSSEHFIPKSRYSTVSRYISNHEYVKDFHNDLHFRKLCPEVRQALQKHGLDDRLSDHITSLFVRSPIPVYEKELVFPCCQASSAHIMEGLKMVEPRTEDNKSEEEQKSDDRSTNKGEEVTSNSSLSQLAKEDQKLAQLCSAWFLKCPPIAGNQHFENLQSTNWNSLRFKNPPTEDSNIGWRVEFRPMDIALTDFENSALTIAVGMIANVVNTFDLDFVLPISLIDENMKRAHNRDGLLNTKFWWKVPVGEDANVTRVAPLRETQFVSSRASPAQEQAAEVSAEEAKARDATRYQELYIWQILNGDESIGYSKGLLQLCQEFMALKQWPQDKVEEVMRQLRFLSDRACGRLPTGASFIRSFVQGHDGYQRDSKLSEQINYDLLKMMGTLNDSDSEARRQLLGQYA